VQLSHNKKILYTINYTKYKTPGREGHNNIIHNTINYTKYNTSGREGTRYYGIF